MTMKDSYFNGFMYKGVRVFTKIEIIGRDEYKPIQMVESSDVYRVFENLRESDKEKFYSMHLDQEKKVIGVEMVSQGTMNQTLVHPREIFKSALLSSAAGLILVHSHPGGNSFPSEEDFWVTKRLKDSGNLIGIEVFDHVIIGHDDYYSFSDKGTL